MWHVSCVICDVSRRAWLLCQSQRLCCCLCRPVTLPSPPETKHKPPGTTETRSKPPGAGPWIACPATPDSRHAQHLASIGMGEFASSKSLKRIRSRVHENEQGGASLSLSAEELELQPLWQNGHADPAGDPPSG